MELAEISNNIYSIQIMLVAFCYCSSLNCDSLLKYMQIGFLCYACVTSTFFFEWDRFFKFFLIFFKVLDLKQKLETKDFV